MGHLTILVAASCICYVHATTVSTDNIDVEKFTLAESKTGRSLPVFKPFKDNIAAPTYNRPPSVPSNVVYGKGGKAARPNPQAYVSPSLKGKPVLSKFKPSVEDTGFDGEQLSSYGQPYKPTQQETAALQKYMQRYASQVVNAQKHAAQLSDNQKHVIATDPYKKYVPPSPQKYKFVPVFSQDSNKDKYRDYDTVEINTEKYQSPFVPIVKSPPKKAFSFDNAQQPSEHKFNNEDIQLANQLMVEPEKSSWGGLEPYQYGLMDIEKNSDLAKITGYKIPAGATSTLTLGHSVEIKEEEKGHESEHEEHYPHHEPKYEYMYQVHDPEKHNNFGHSEARKGKNTWGRYYVQLPDGRLETVKYWVDKSGYHAEVDFKGEAKHPSHKEYAHSQKEDSAKAYPKISQSETAGLSGHSEAQFTMSDAISVGEEY